MEEEGRESLASSRLKALSLFPPPFLGDASLSAAGREEERSMSRPTGPTRKRSLGGTSTVGGNQGLVGELAQFPPSVDVSRLLRLKVGPEAGPILEST